VIPISASQRAGAAAIRERLAAAGLRSRLDDGDATLSRRIAQAHHDGVPIVAVIGDRELRDGTLSLRSRDGQHSVALAEAVADVVRRCAVPSS
jgi:threonyl-tRNA synthetase